MSVTAENQPAAPPSEAAQQVLQIATSYILSSCLQIAARLKIADRLATGPQNVAAVAGAIGVNEDALYRVLRALAVAGIFTESGPRTFALTPAAETLRTDAPGSTHPMALWMTDPFHLRVYADLMHSVKTGLPAVEQTVGMPIFEHFASDAAESEVFNNAMTAFSAAVGPAVVAAYDFSGIATLVDIAGGHGEILMTVLRKHPAMRGILFDLEHVLAGARPRIAAAGLESRIRTETGDFFTAVPAGGDAYMMKHIIHDWADDKAITILRNIRRALQDRPNGRVILIESVIQTGNQPDFGKLIDIEMLAMPGGRERTADEFGALFAAAGFRLSRIVPTASPLAIIEGTPA